MPAESRSAAIAEQRAIAHILGTLDDKIELNRRMNETLEAMARALFKSWFVDFDPVRAKAEGRDPGLPKPLADLFPARLVDSELGEIPEGWEVKPLDELARFLNGLALQKYPPIGGAVVSRSSRSPNCVQELPKGRTVRARISSRPTSFRTATFCSHGPALWSACCGRQGRVR